MHLTYSTNSGISANASTVNAEKAGIEDWDCESDVYPEVFERQVTGDLREVCTGSDADYIVEGRHRHGEIMRFRLTYDGELKAEGKDSRGPEKWEIRNHISPQLAELWELHPALLGKTFGYARVDGLPAGTKLSHHLKERLRLPVVVGGQEFIPLVRTSFALTCSLDILFLRKQTRGSLVSEGGDLDNRIKTFLDGLTVPKEGQMSSGTPISSPLFCLLEDDKLIADLAVRTDRLLTRPGGSTSEVRLMVDVIVKTTQVTLDNTGFLGD